MRVKNDNLTLDGTDMTADIASEPLWLGHIVNYSVQAVYTGAPNGTLKLQGSNDEGSRDVDVANATITNWTDIAGTSTAISAAGSTLFDEQNAGYRWIRLVWINSASGASTLSSARYNVKGI